MIVFTLRGILTGSNSGGPNTVQPDQRAQEIREIILLVLESKKKELCFNMFRVLLETDHHDLLLDVCLYEYIELSEGIFG